MHYVVRMQPGLCFCHPNQITLPFWYLLIFFLSLEKSLVFFLLRTAHVSDLHYNTAQPMRKKGEDSVHELMQLLWRYLFIEELECGPVGHLSTVTGTHTGHFQLKKIYPLNAMSVPSGWKRKRRIVVTTEPQITSKLYWKRKADLEQGWEICNSYSRGLCFGNWCFLIYWSVTRSMNTVSLEKCLFAIWENWSLNISNMGITFHCNVTALM